MFGQSDTDNNSNDNQAAPMDPGVMADPSSMPAVDQPVQDHQMTPAYQDDNMVQQPDPQQDENTQVDAPVASDEADSDLLSIKQDALNALSPLVGQLDQSPEEKFRTTMMMIQASDDRTLVKQAYSAAQEITDEKVRAQALLDVINEINYFTSHTS